jgi:hypothetical protein
MRGGPEHSLDGVFKDAAEILFGLAQFILVAFALGDIAERADEKVSLASAGLRDHRLQGHRGAVGPASRDLHLIACTHGVQQGCFGVVRSGNSPCWQQVVNEHSRQRHGGMPEDEARAGVGGDDAQGVRGEDDDRVGGAFDDGLGLGDGVVQGVQHVIVTVGDVPDFRAGLLGGAQAEIPGGGLPVENFKKIVDVQP